MSAEQPAPEPGELLEGVVVEACLVATAFRLRDPEALQLTLRRLVEATERLEVANDNRAAANDNRQQGSAAD